MCVSCSTTLIADVANVHYINNDQVQIKHHKAITTIYSSLQNNDIIQEKPLNKNSLASYIAS